MKILLVNGTLYGGGAERVIGTLAENLRRQGHMVTIVVILGGGDVQDQLIESGFEVITEFMNKSGARTPVGLAYALQRIVQEREIDVIHSHDSRSLVDAGLCRILTRGLRHVHTFHFGNYPNLPMSQLWLERLFTRVPDRLVAVGYQQRSQIVKSLYFSSDSRVNVVWNGLDQPETSEVQDQGEKSDWSGVPVIGSMSTLTEQKGLPVLLEAARLLVDKGVEFRLRIVGAGPMLNELVRLSGQYHLKEIVTFTDWVRDAARMELPKFDIFVQSSLWEAMSVVVMEAMAAGKPMVVTSVGDNDRVIDNGVNGITVSPGSADELARELQRLIENPPEAREFATNAKEKYERMLTGCMMSARYVDLYLSACGNMDVR